MSPVPSGQDRNHETKHDRAALEKMVASRDRRIAIAIALILHGGILFIPVQLSDTIAIKAEQIVQLKLAPALSPIPRQRKPLEPARLPPAEASTPVTTTNTTVLPQPEPEPANVTGEKAAPNEQSLATSEAPTEESLPVPVYPPSTLTEKPVIAPRLDSIAGLGPFKSVGKRPLAEGGEMKPLPSHEAVAQDIPNIADNAKMPESAVESPLPNPGRAVTETPPEPASDYPAPPTATVKKPDIPTKLAPAAELKIFQAITKPALAKNKAEKPLQSVGAKQQEVSKIVAALVPEPAIEALRQDDTTATVSPLSEPLPDTSPHPSIPPLPIQEPIEVATPEAEAPYSSLRGTSTPAEMPTTEHKASSSVPTSPVPNFNDSFTSFITHGATMTAASADTATISEPETGKRGFAVGGEGEGVGIDENESTMGSAGSSTIIRPAPTDPPARDPDSRENPALPESTDMAESSPTVAPPVAISSVEETLARISALIAERKTYPEAAKLRRAEGTVRVGVSIRKDGSLKSSKIVTRSGSAVLDRAATDLVKGLFPIPFNLATEMEVVATIEYRLTH